MASGLTWAGNERQPVVMSETARRGARALELGSVPVQPVSKVPCATCGTATPPSSLRRLPLPPSSLICSACHKEWLRRLLLPSALPRSERPQIHRRGDCYFCHRELEGGQRVWCSERCRKRVNRAQRAFLARAKGNRRPQRPAVTFGTRAIRLSSTEERLYRRLLRDVDKVIDRDALLRAAWGQAYVGEWHMLQVNITRLRNKLHLRGDPYQIVTHINLGYHLEAIETATEQAA